MGKKSRVKKERVFKPNNEKANVMDPTLMKAFMRGRDAGYKEGKTDGIFDTLHLFHNWTEEIKDQVKGIGGKTQQTIQDYYARRISETIEKNKITKNSQ